MKVVTLIAENVKKLRAVEITPDGAVVAITGKNGAGKSSVLDALWWALAGTKHIQAVPIRKGASKARIKLDLGELVVERKISKSGSQLTVKSADGAKYASPQGMLDELLGALTFDPLAFVNEKPADQLEQLKAIAGLDFDEVDTANEVDYMKRLEINREAKRLRASAESIEVPADTEAVAIDTGPIKDAMAAAAEINSKRERQQADKNALATRIEGVEELAEGCKRKAADLREAAKREEHEQTKHEQLAMELRRKLVEMPTPVKAVDVEELRSKLDAAEEQNAIVDQINKKADYMRRARVEEEKSEKLTSAMRQRDDDKAQAIANAPMPVEGLGFGDGYVTLNGIPFEQASTSEQLRVSASIAMAANPKLRVIRIKDGSALDSDSMKALGDLATEKDYQVWIEKVDESGKVGIVIEDGAVVAVNE